MANKERRGGRYQAFFLKNSRDFDPKEDSNGVMGMQQSFTTKPEFDKGIVMMNHNDGWMNGWMGGGMWLWAVIGTLLVVLLVVAINKISKK